jgi:hypothetical protein
MRVQVPPPAPRSPAGIGPFHGAVAPLLCKILALHNPLTFLGNCAPLSGAGSRPLLTPWFSRGDAKPVRGPALRADRPRAGDTPGTSRRRSRVGGTIRARRCVAYSRGSRVVGVTAGQYATVTDTDAKQNLLTVERQDGQNVSYDPRRLQGISVWREAECDFAEGDRVQFTAP